MKLMVRKSPEQIMHATMMMAAIPGLWNLIIVYGEITMRLRANMEVILIAQQFIKLKPNCYEQYLNKIPTV